MAELIKSRSSRSTYLLHVNGHLYYKNGGKIGERSYWKCRRVPECSARAIITGGPDNIEVVKSGDHNHAPNPEEVKAEKIVSGMKRSAEEHPEAPPAQVVRNALRGVPSNILAELPERVNLSKGIGRVRLRNLPSNPLRMEDLREIPTDFRNTLAGESFLLYDSFEENENGTDGRIIIYASPENLRHLFRSNVWFVDGTFKCAPSIFYQLFAIMGAVAQVTTRETHTIGVPFVYALLENKRECVYKKVFEVIVARAQELNIVVKFPSVVMSDFELGIINAARQVIGENVVRCCLFHLAQSVYRHVQSKGLQARYADPEDSSIRDAARILVALAFVPPDDIESAFDLLASVMPEDFKEVYKYFENTYVRSRMSRGRGRARIGPPRYSTCLWSQYFAVLQGTARTNNISEGWHNRLQVVIGKDHPSFYAFIVELKKEQADSEIMLRQLQLGQKVRKGQDPKRKKTEEKIATMVLKYNEYVENEDVLKYLKTLSYNIKM